MGRSGQTQTRWAGGAMNGDGTDVKLPRLGMFIAFAVVFIAALLVQHAVGVPWMHLQLAIASVLAMGAEWGWVVVAKRIRCRWGPV